MMDQLICARVLGRRSSRGSALTCLRKKGDTLNSRWVTSKFNVAVRTSRVCAYSVFAFFTAGSATAVAIVQKRAGAGAAGSSRAASRRGHCSTVLTQRITVIKTWSQNLHELLKMLPANAAK